VEARLREAGATAAGAFPAALTRMLDRTIANSFNLLIKGFIMLFALFYFLRDGAVWLGRLRDAVPLSPRVWDLVLARFRDTLRAVVHGMLLSAAILALLLAAGYRLTGVPVPAFLGMLSFFAAPIPFVGVLIVWVPACVYLLLFGSPERCLALTGYGIVVIFLVDNILRPAIIGSIAKLPVFFMLIAILGGLIAYGPLGLFLGPVLLAIALAVGGVYREIAARPGRG
jgi:predicted PurR-regulated permease PerM